MVDTVVAEGTRRGERLDMGGADTLNVEGAFIVRSENQTVRFTAPTAGAEIVNEGTLTNIAEEGRAIRFESDIGESLEATITNRSVIRAGDDAVQIQDGELSSGLLAFENAAGATIVSVGGQALDFAGAGGAFLAQVVNAGLIIGETNDGVRIGSIGEIANSGTIIGGRADGYDGSVDGVQFEEEATGTVRNEAGGRILGDRHGVNADDDSVITVINAAGGRISGSNGSGVGSDGDATVVNRGVIIGAFSDLEGTDVNGATPGAEDGGGPDGINDGDGDGVDADGLLTLQNYGLIAGTGAGGNGSDGFANTAEGVAAGGGTIENFEGGRIVGAGLGILIDDSSRGNAPFLTEITNEGQIVGGTGPAIRIVSNLDDTVENGGLIRGGDGVAIEFGSGDNTLSISAGSRIEGLSVGGEGVDTLDYAGFGKAVFVDLESGSAIGTGGVRDFENVSGSAQRDRLFGDDGGNTLNGARGGDALDGRGGDDVLNGGRGADVLTGGAGEDIFAFTAPLVGGEVDRIADFTVGEDTLRLNRGAFEGLSRGALAENAFAVGAEAIDADDRLVYDDTTGALLFDRDGSGEAAAIEFARLTAGLDLSASDFLIV